MMQLKGSALRIPFTELQHAFDSTADVRHRVLEFAQAQSAVTAQIAACNRLHTAEERLARWLLMSQDLTGYDTLEFTQEYLAQMLAAQRTTVTVIAGNLQRQGMIEYSRGRIRIVNCALLESTACVCYPIIKRFSDCLYQGSAAPPPPPRVPAVAAS
jgi:CRP-like cAMP-binding protein